MQGCKVGHKDVPFFSPPRTKFSTVPNEVLKWIKQGWKTPPGRSRIKQTHMFGGWKLLQVKGKEGTFLLNMLWSPSSQGSEGVYQIGKIYRGCSWAQSTDKRNEQEGIGAARSYATTQPQLHAHLVEMAKEGKLIRCRTIIPMKEAGREQIFEREEREIERGIIVERLPLCNQVVSDKATLVRERRKNPRRRLNFEKIDPDTFDAKVNHFRKTGKLNELLRILRQREGGLQTDRVTQHL